MGDNIARNPYTDAAIYFTQTIREISPEAADCVEHIGTKYGTRAASLAAIALVALWQKCERGHAAFDFKELQSSDFYMEMLGVPAALQLFEEAAKHLLSQRAGRK